MKNRNRKHNWWLSCLLILALLAGCQTANTATDATATNAQASRSLAPERVDIRGTILNTRYDQGQVILEVEGFTSPNSRYNRAYVLVVPTAQITGPGGKTISLSELRVGDNVAINLRGGGRGNLVGVGVARRVWVEESL